MTNNRADDLFHKVTNEMIAAIEEGAPQWRMPWLRLGQAHVSIAGRPYRGLNVWLLAQAADEGGYASHQWGTYKAWQAEGFQVQKGQHSTEVVLWKQTNRKDPDDPERTRKSLYATTFRVFAREQTDAPPLERPELSQHDLIERAEAYFAELPGEVSFGGDRAYYAPAADRIAVPLRDQFHQIDHFYTTLGHEYVHWTGHETRLKRDLRGRFGDDSYAAEELIAELGAAFIGAQLELDLAVRQDHSSYLAGWLRILKADHKAILTASSKAQEAVDLLNKLAEFDPAPTRELETV